MRECNDPRNDNIYWAIQAESEAGHIEKSLIQETSVFHIEKIDHCPMNDTRANPRGLQNGPPGTGGLLRDNQGMSESEPDRPAYARVTRSHKGVDAEARRKERRERLIEAGLQTLGTKGLHVTTVRDVCGQAGLSERYFYESFSGLGELFGTIYQALHQELLGRLMAVLVSSRGQHQPALEGGKAALTVWFNFLKEDPRRARIMLIDAMGGNEGGAHGAKAAARDYVGTIQAFLDLLYPGLPAQHLSSRLLSAALLGACIHTAKEWIWSGFEAPMETIVAHMVVIFQALDSHYQWASIAQNAKR